MHEVALKACGRIDISAFNSGLSMEMGKPVRILTNFVHFPASWAALNFAGTAIVVRDASGFLRNLLNADLILVDSDVSVIIVLVFVFSLFPFLKKPIVAVDLVLRKPEGLASRASALLKRLLFARVDHFIHYFRDLRGYREYYGIGANRSSFVYFKPNIRDQFQPQSYSDGEYVLCFGRSLRDYDTFFDAVEVLPYPAAIPTLDFKLLRAHGSRFSRKLADLPDRLSVLEDDGTPSSLVRIFQRARIVVIPILGHSLCASGIGTYLNAMWMGKCVIISEGPGASDVLSNEAILVPAEDTTALIAAIRRAWEDRELREAVADAGRHFAESLGGEQALMQRILDVAVSKFFSTDERPP